MLERRVEATPDRNMLSDEHDRACTWSEFFEWTQRVAAGLADLGIKRGDVVSWQLPTRIETIVLSMALDAPRCRAEPDYPSLPPT